MDANQQKAKFASHVQNFKLTGADVCAKYRFSKEAREPTTAELSAATNTLLARIELVPVRLAHGDLFEQCEQILRSALTVFSLVTSEASSACQRPPTPKMMKILTSYDVSHFIAFGAAAVTLHGFCKVGMNPPKDIMDEVFTSLVDEIDGPIVGNRNPNSRFTYVDLEMMLQRAIAVFIERTKAGSV